MTTADALKKRKVFAFPSTAFRSLHPENFNLFSRNFAGSFGIYNGKDSLKIIKLDDTQDSPALLQRFAAIGVSQTSVAEVLAVNSSGTWGAAPSTEDANTEDTKNDSSEYSAQYTDAVLKIQRFCRKYLTRVQEANRFRETAQGQITESLLIFLGGNMPPELSMQTRIAIRVLFLTEVLELQMKLSEVLDGLEFIRQTARGLFDDKTLLTQLEMLDQQWTSLKDQEIEANGLKKTWSMEQLKEQRWWLDPNELRTKVERDSRALRRVEKDSEKLASKLEDIRKL